MKLLIDGDGSHQMKTAVMFAEEKNIPAHIYCDYNHQICLPYATVHTVEQSPNSADHAILACCQPNDILLTNDIGLAAIALAKGVYVLNNHGYVYSDANIAMLLNSRHMHKEARRKTKKRNIHKDRINSGETHASFMSSLYHVYHQACRKENSSENNEKREKEVIIK